MIEIYACLLYWVLWNSAIMHISYSNRDFRITSSNLQIGGDIVSVNDDHAADYRRQQAP